MSQEKYQKLMKVPPHITEQVENFWLEYFGKTREFNEMAQDENARYEKQKFGSEIHSLESQLKAAENTILILTDHILNLDWSVAINEKQRKDMNLLMMTKQQHLKLQNERNLTVRQYIQKLTNRINENEETFAKMQAEKASLEVFLANAKPRIQNLKAEKSFLLGKLTEPGIYQETLRIQANDNQEIEESDDDSEDFELHDKKLMFEDQPTANQVKKFVPEILLNENEIKPKFCFPLMTIPCKHCDRSFAYQSDAKIHIIRNHFEPLQCAMCPKTFQVKGVYKTHVQTIHQGFQRLIKMIDSLRPDYDLLMYV